MRNHPHSKPLDDVFFGLTVLAFTGALIVSNGIEFYERVATPSPRDKYTSATPNAQGSGVAVNVARMQSAAR
jgi:hypothetical protein